MIAKQHTGSSPMRKINFLCVGTSVFLLVITFYTSKAQTSVDTVSAKHSLAMKLKSPMANVLVLRMQNSLDLDANADITRNTFNIEPTIPVEPYLNWKVVTYIQAPVIYQQRKNENHGTYGLGDIRVTGWLMPNFRMNGWILGAGGVINLPTATDELLGHQKLGVGPSTVMVKQTGGLTVGLLWNHIWSIAGPGQYPMSVTTVNPWISYMWLNTTSVDFEIETSYDWHIDKWIVPLRLGVSRMVYFDKLPLTISFDGLHYLAAGSANPKWGASASIAMVIR
jgi:hypothetical protein